MTINSKLTQICIQWQNLASLETRSVFKQTWPMSQWLEQMQNWVQNPHRWHWCHLLFLHWYICKKLSPSDLIHFKSESPLTMIFFNVSLINPLSLPREEFHFDQIHNFESMHITPWRTTCIFSAWVQTYHTLTHSLLILLLLLLSMLFCFIPDVPLLYSFPVLLLFLFFLLLDSRHTTPWLACFQFPLLSLASCCGWPWNRCWKI